MFGITSTELKLPSFRKRTWIGISVITLFIFLLVLLPGIIYFNFQVEWRVAAAIHMIPDAELLYSDTTEQNGFMTIRKFIYWVNLPFEQVKDYPFVTNYREDSDPNRKNMFSEITSDYSYRVYFLSDLPQKELDSILYFESDLCCYGDVPHSITPISFYVISASWSGEKSYDINTLDYEHLAGKETTGTYIVYTYRVR